MGAAYSQDLRDRVLGAYDRGLRTKQISELFQISPAYARRVKQRRRDHGESSPRSMGGLRVVKVDLERLRQWVIEKPDATIRELHQRLNQECGIQCSESAVGMALVRCGLSFKKRRCTPPSRTGLMLLTNAENGPLSNLPGQRAG